LNNEKYELSGKVAGMKDFEIKKKTAVETAE